MSADKSEERFDEMLGRGLRKRAEPVPDDFTDRMLRRVREEQQRRILARVIMEERLALAGCILLGIITVIMAAVFPGIAGSFTKQAEVFIDKITQIIEAVGGQWQFYTVLAGAFGFAVYSLVDLLVGDS